MGSCRTAGVSLYPNQDFNISTSPLHRKMEYTELRLTHWVAAFPWPRFSDARILGSKYRNLGLRQSEAPAARHEPIYLLLFSVTLWLRGVLLLLKRRMSRRPSLNRPAAVTF